MSLPTPVIIIAVIIAVITLLAAGAGILMIDSNDRYEAKRAQCTLQGGVIVQTANNSFECINATTLELE